jgi:hypothetical protein
VRPRRTKTQNPGQSECMRLGTSRHHAVHRPLCACTRTGRDWRGRSAFSGSAFRAASFNAMPLLLSRSRLSAHHCIIETRSSRCSPGAYAARTSLPSMWRSWRSMASGCQWPDSLSKLDAVAPKAVRGDFVFGVTETSESGVQCVVRDLARRRSNTWKQLGAAAGQRPKRHQQLNRLTGEWHAMWSAHFRSRGWKRPNRTFEIELDPFRCPELSGAGNKKRHQLQRDSSSSLTLEGINRAQERSQGFWVGDRGSRSRFHLA